MKTTLARDGASASVAKGGSLHLNMTKAWFCLKSQPKHEHIAGAQLRQWEGVEVFCPRIRFRRKTRTGAVWVTEALFPGYLFACFEMEHFLCRVRSARGIKGIVRFGEKYPLVPETVIEDLRTRIGPQELATITPPMEPGLHATIAAGALGGLDCIIHHLLPARRRVAVLLTLLGQITLVELNEGDLVPRPLHPAL